MNILLQVVGAFLSFNFVSPVLMYYIYDDNPNAGYLAVGGIGDFVKKMPAHKKYFIGNGNQKNMKLVNERAVDSYFRILKSSPKSFPVVRVKDQNYTSLGRSSNATEPPKRSLKKIEQNGYAVRNSARKEEDTVDEAKAAPNVNQISKRNDGQLFDPSENDYFNRNVNKNGNGNEKQQNSISKDHKFLTESNSQNLNIKMKDRHSHRAQNYHQKTHPSGIKDKILHKANVNNERNARTMARMLNDITQKVIDRKSQKEREYRKRHTIDKTPNRPENNEQKVKHLDNSDKKSTDPDRRMDGSFKKLERHHMPARIGNYDVGREIKDPPYALFYRMNHEDLEQPELLTVDGRTTPEEPYYGHGYYRGDVTRYEDLSTGRREAINTFSAMHNRLKQYTAFRDR